LQNARLTLAPRHLFVYGSLLSSQTGPLGAAERRSMRWMATRVGFGIVHGRLYDLGSYPGAIAGRSRCEVIPGEIWRLRDAPNLLAILDAYEDAGGPNPMYARKRITAWPAGGSPTRQPVAAWIYLYVVPLTPTQESRRLRRLPSGHWQR
jgi:gamma-glutamylcyclotransferase (GGCT)/AIG2-like uncharacterized protein YtfP